MPKRMTLYLSEITGQSWHEYIRKRPVRKAVPKEKE